MKRMESPSAVGVAVDTTKVDPGATAATTTGTKVATMMVCHVQIPSRYRCLHWQTTTEKRTRGLSKAVRLRHFPPWWSPSSFV
jgi:hypothetical protein